MNADGNKAITSASNNKYKFGTVSNVIDGEILGGTTGIEQEVFKRKNAKDKTGDVNTTDVATLPFYFKIWTPFDYNTGVLMIQSYSTQTMTLLIKSNLSRYIQKYNYNLIFTSYIPDEVIEKYKKRSNVYKVAYVKDKLTKGKRKLINPIFAEYDNLKIKIEISGFKKSIEEFWDAFTKSDKTIGSNLEDFDIKEEEDYEVIAYYKDDNGHKSNTSIAKDLKFQPTIFLPDTIKVKDKQYYDFEKIKNHTESILKTIKEKIKY